MQLNQNIKLLLIGFGQLTFLSANTFFISQKNYMMIGVSALFTNFIFSWAVKTLAFSGWKDRLMYALGSTAGCILGTYTASLFL